MSAEEMAAKDDDPEVEDAEAQASGEGEDGADTDGDDEDDAGDGRSLTEAALGTDDDIVEPVDYVELVKIHNVRDANEAHVVQSILESFHIPCSTEDGAIDNFGGLLPTQLDGIDIFVPARFEKKAKDVLCERNIVCGVEQGRMDALLALAGEDAGTDAAKRKALLEKVAEETRDYRHEALGKIGKRGKQGFELLRTLVRESLRADGTAQVALDVAALTDHGTFGPENALLVLDDLDHVKGDEDAAVRRRCATALGRLRGLGAGPALVDLLGDEDAAVRDEALESLYALSGGETFDFDPDLTPASQAHAIAQWRAWARDNARA